MLKIVISKRYFMNATVKGKAVPLQAWSGPEGSRKLRFPDKVKQLRYRSGVAQRVPGS
jgi:hypothetical protein